MPRELVATAPRTPVLRGYVERPLKPGEVRIRSRLSAEKHGTSLTVYRGEVPGVTFPIALGNMSVGIVAETAVGVTGLKLGDRVYGYLPVRETHVVGEERVSLAPEELHDEELVCIDPAVVALMAVREGRLRLGDNAAVFGTGAIGLFAVQMAKLSGCMLVVAVEPVGKRRRLAERFGADRVVDPTAEDAVSKIKELTDGKGVDVALEVSGQYRVLNQAIKATRYAGTVVPVSWYHGEASGLYLGEEWHFNRQVLVSGARVESEPYREFPIWDRKRVYATVIELFRRRELTTEGMIDPVVELENAAEAYRAIDERPSESVKLGVKYG